MELVAGFTAFAGFFGSTPRKSRHARGPFPAFVMPSRENLLRPVAPAHWRLKLPRQLERERLRACRHPGTASDFTAFAGFRTRQYVVLRGIEAVDVPRGWGDEHRQKGLSRF
jgi:hypothetical protein